jgi:toxin-antitoxin system PIN domain toxin
VNLVDANVLLYAVNTSDPKHHPSRTWLDGALSRGETVGFAWLVLLAFLRLSTKTGLFPTPLAPDQAIQAVRRWTDQPSAIIVEPTPRHAIVLGDLLRDAGTGGNLVSDAHLAALALEHQATVISYDRDFGRFPGVRWQPPHDQARPDPG